MKILHIGRSVADGISGQDKVPTYRRARKQLAAQWLTESLQVAWAEVTRSTEAAIWPLDFLECTTSFTRHIRLIHSTCDLNFDPAMGHHQPLDSMIVFL